MRLLFIIFSIIFLGNNLLFSQNNNGISTDLSGANWIEMMQDPNVNFYSTQSSFKEYWRNKTHKKGDGWKVFKRWEAFNQTRVSQDGVKPSADYLQEIYNQMYASGSAFASANGVWTELGPSTVPVNGTTQPNGIGRINDIAFDPTDSNVIWVGAPAGGLWKSSNGGQTWISLTDDLPTLGVSSILIDDNNTSKMYIGTGDRDAADSPGKGVYKSTNGGATWTSSSNGMGNKTINKLVMKSSNHNEILAATNGGIYKTTGAGGSWFLKSVVGNFKDICYNPSNSNIVYATKSSSSGAEFYRSFDGGGNWTKITVGLPTNAYRMAISVTASSYNTVYLVAANSSGLVGVYKSTNSGGSFSLKSSTPNILGYSITGSDNSSQAWYDLAIEVEPNSTDTLYVGGINTWKSTDGGVTWSIVGHWVGNTTVPAVHADQHCLKFSPLTGDLYNGNDGGIYKTSNAGASWTDISSGLGISQIYRIGQDPSSSQKVVAGFQDNGTAVLNNSIWTTEIGGDGMECIIDPTNSSIIYGSLYYGKILRSSNSGATFTTIADSLINGITEVGAWITPYCLKEGGHNTMFIGYDNIWRSTNVNTTNSINFSKISSFSNVNKVSVVENSPADNNILYAAVGASIYRSDNVNATSPTWSTISGPGGTITDIEADPFSANIVYVTAGHNVFKSINKGVSWVSISGNLPSVTMNCIVYDTSSSDGLYVGTDLGVFYKDSAISNWINYSLGMPATPMVTDLQIYYDVLAMNSKIRASTFGRGLWTSDLYINPSAPITADFSVNSTSICENGSLIFSDMSLPIPTSWKWIISPSTHSFVNGTSSTSQNPEVEFTAMGNYSVTLIASNASGPDTIVKTNYISVTSFYNTPYIEDFESFFPGNPGTWNNGWTYSNTGGFNWRAKNGITQTSYTGPMKDHTIGNTSGKYLYTEASYPASQGDVTNLISPCVSIQSSGSVALSFWYHMVGSGIEGLHVDIFDNGVWTNDIYSLIGPQQTYTYSSWLEASVSLSAYLGKTVKFRFRVIRGASDKSDVAIDDFSVKAINAPINDEPSGAITLNVGNNVCNYDTCTNINATTSVGILPPGCGGSISEDVWYKILVPSSGELVIDANPISGFFNDGAMAAYKGSSSSLALVDCNDDFIGSGSMPRLHLQNQTPNDTIFIRFWKYNGGTGKFLLCVKNPPHFLIKPSNINVGSALGSASLYIVASPNITWSLSDNASWLTVSPSSGTGSDTVLVSYSANSSGSRQGRVKGIAAGMNNKYSYITQQASVVSDFNYSSQMICNGETVTFTNTSIGASSYIWYLNGTQVSTSTNYSHTFNSVGDYTVMLKATGVTYTDSIIKGVFVGSSFTANAGTDTIICSGYDLVLSPGVNVGINSCDSNCNMPSYCNSASANNSQEYITKVEVGSVSNYSTNIGGGYYDYSQSVFRPVIVDSSYSITITGFTIGSWLEYVDVYIDWNRNGLFDEPAISLGSATFDGSHDFNGIITVPNTSVSGKTKMRVIMKYNSAINSACGWYNYGETEDYQIEIIKNEVLSHSWAGPLSFSSNEVNLSVNNMTSNKSGDYYLTVHNAYNCQSIDTVNVNVIAAPVVSLSGIPDFCEDEGAYTLIEGSPIGGVYSGTGVSTGNFTPSVAGVGSHTITYTVTNSSNCSSEALQIITVFESPIVSFTGLPSSICMNEANVILTGSPQGGIFSGDGVEQTNQFNPSLAGAGNHTIKYKYTSGGNCSDSATNSIVVYDLPSVNAGSDTTINYNNTAKLKAIVTGLLGTASYSWSPSNLVVSPSSSTTLTNQLSVSTIFSVEVTDNSTTCIGSDDKMVNVIGGPLSIASINVSSDTICSGDSISLVVISSGGNGNVNYSWSSIPSGFSSNIAIQTVAPLVSTTYIVSVSDNNTTLIDSVSVFVNSTPQVYFDIISSLCEDEGVVNMTSISPAGGVFSGQGVVGATFDPQISGVGTFPITYSYSGTSSCVGTMVKNITVNPLPNVEIQSLSPTCNTSAPISLTGGSPYGGTYSGVGVLGNQFNPQSVGMGIYTITYSFTSQDQCSSSDSTTIIVNSSPIANAGADQQIANGSSASLSGSGNGGSGNYNYYWSPSSMFVDPNISNPTTVSLSNSQLFSMKIEDVASSCSDSDLVIVTVTGGTLSAALYASQSPVCKGDSLTLTAIGSGATGNYSYQWASVPSGFSSTLQSVRVAPIATTAYKVTITEASASASASQFIVVDAVPEGILPSDTAMCSNGQISLDAGGGYDSYLWSNGEITQIIDIEADDLQYGFTNYYVTITNTIGCSIVDTSEVEVREAPSNLIADDSVCNTLATYTYVAIPNMSSYLWNTGDSTQSIIINTGDLVLGNNSFWVSVIDEVGCSGSDTAFLRLYLCETIFELENGNNVKVYPNPSKGIVNIEINSDISDDISIFIYDSQSKLVYKESTSIDLRNNKIQINLDKLSRGIYLMHIKGKNTYNIQKLIIQ